MVRRFRALLALICVPLIAAFLLTACSLGSSSNNATPVGTAAPTTAPTSSSTTTPATPAATTAPTAGSATTSSATTSAATAAPSVASPTALATRSAASTTAGTATATTTLTSAPTTAGQAISAAEINDRARPAIVQITNNQQQRGPFGTSGFQIPAGVGTGFIFDKRGYIMTNNHVVEGANSITVTTTDNKTFDAKLVGRYPQGDLAVIQINGNGDLPTVALGDSSKLRVGEPVVAIGNALALPGGPTVTMGVVSALGRVQQEPNNGPQPGAFLVDLIQTDAAINPGNSGGPLFNMQGEVVGINTLGVTQAEQGVPAQGINFAISINSAKPVADALIAGTPIPRPFLGIASDSLSPVQDAQLGLPANTGIGIASVTPGSPADKAGVKAGDVILKFDGQTIQGEEGFVGLLLKHKPGDSVTLTIMRGKQQQDVQVTLGQAPTS